MWRGLCATRININLDLGGPGIKDLGPFQQLNLVGLLHVACYQVYVHVYVYVRVCVGVCVCVHVRMCMCM